MRWPKGPPHLALNPPYFFVFVFFVFVCFFFAFLSLFFLNRQKKPVSPPKKTFFVYFQCLPLFLFSRFWASPFLPFSLSLSLSCYFLSSFLFFILSFWFLLFLFVVFAFFVSRCSFVFVFLLVVLCSFQS